MNENEKRGGNEDAKPNKDKKTEWQNDRMTEWQKQEEISIQDGCDKKHQWKRKMNKEARSKNKERKSRRRRKAGRQISIQDESNNNHPHSIDRIDYILLCCCCHLIAQFFVREQQPFIIDSVFLQDGRFLIELALNFSEHLRRAENNQTRQQPTKQTKKTRNKQRSKQTNNKTQTGKSRNERMMEEEPDRRSSNRKWR